MAVDEGIECLAAIIDTNWDKNVLRKPDIREEWKIINYSAMNNNIIQVYEDNVLHDVYVLTGEGRDSEARVRIEMNAKNRIDFRKLTSQTQDAIHISKNNPGFNFSYLEIIAETPINNGPNLWTRAFDIKLVRIGENI